MPQKQNAKKQVDSYPQDDMAKTAPAIRIEREIHQKMTRDQFKNRIKRSRMTDRELLADDLKILRKYKTPNNKIKEILKLNKQKYGFKKKVN